MMTPYSDTNEENDPQVMAWNAERERLEGLVTEAATALLRHTGAGVIRLRLEGGMACFLGVQEEIAAMAAETA